MSDNTEKTYEVGYKKPPVATRFKKGQPSPWPAGRPKKKKALALQDPGAILETIDNEPIPITEKGKRKLMRKAEIQHRLLFTKAIKGHLPTARLLLNMATQYFTPEERENRQIVFITDTEVEQRFGRNRYNRKNASVSGKPIELVSTSYLFRKVANEEVEIEVQGCKKTVTYWEALVRQIHTMALNNDFGAARLVHLIRQRFPGKAASGGTTFFICRDEDLNL